MKNILLVLGDLSHAPEAKEEAKKFIASKLRQMGPDVLLLTVEEGNVTSWAREASRGICPYECYRKDGVVEQSEPSPAVFAWRHDSTTLDECVRAVARECTRSTREGGTVLALFFHVGHGEPYPYFYREIGELSVFFGSYPYHLPWLSLAWQEDAFEEWPPPLEKGWFVSSGHGDGPCEIMGKWFEDRFMTWDSKGSLRDGGGLTYYRTEIEATRAWVDELRESARETKEKIASHQRYLERLRSEYLPEAEARLAELEKGARP